MPKLVKINLNVGDIYEDWEILEFNTVNLNIHTIVTLRHICGRVKKCSGQTLIYNRGGCCFYCKAIKHKSNIKTYKKLGRKPLPANKLISSNIIASWRRMAFRNNREYNINVDYLESILVKQNLRCAFTGIKLIFDNPIRSKNTISLDRIDSSKDYVEGNLQLVHKLVNRMKSDLSDDHFINLCKMIADYRSDVDFVELDGHIRNYRKEKSIELN